MASVINGTAVFWSTGGITFTGGILSSDNASLVQSTTLERTSDVTRIKGSDGSIRTVVFSAPVRNLRMTIIPCGGTSTNNTIAKAKTSAQAHCPAPGTAITVADDAGTDTVLEKTYNCITATQNRTVDGVVTIDLTLEASDEGIDITTAVS